MSRGDANAPSSAGRNGVPQRRHPQRALCIIGAGAAFVAVAADLALQYTPIAAHVGARDYSYLLDVPPGRMLFGHFAGVVAVIVEILGFLGVAVGIESRGLRHVFFGFASFGFAIGAAFHAMFAAIGLTLQRATAAGSPPELVSGLATAVWPAHHGLGAIILGCIVVLSCLLSIAIARGRTRYPRWMALLTPLPVAILFFIVQIVFPPLRLVLFPAGLNLANLILFVSAAVNVKPLNGPAQANGSAASGGPALRAS
ncbi:MAG TPA: DUF6796 family protein [Candidatus Polarisedimenticolia bacterium]|nr:DUF6796 family protein [Candidatus Polarisedimenticolia bacterium]